MLKTAPKSPSTNPYQASSIDDRNLQYRSLNRAAVGSVVLCFLGLTAFLFWQLLILLLAGFLLGLSAYRTIKRYPDEYTGMGLARAGMVLSLALFVIGSSYHSIVYATEVPEGHERITFGDLQPENPAVGPMVPKRAVELRGKKVFIKGFMHPGVSGMGKVDQFVLVPDMGTCCFGGQPKPTDMILVHTTPDSKVAFVRHSIGLAGEFDVGERFEDFAGVENVLYRLEAYQAK